ncbi:MAG: (Fe-S)-binding protein [Candidatus Helarchaeota archaeon]|nr:(Fe-S)-binding protein [Candidatus Helarchaeota archaeon]
MTLESFKDWIYTCIRCNTCKYVMDEYSDSCPAGEKFQLETYWGSGKIWIARGILEKKLQFSDSIVKKIFACPTCGSCMKQCELEISDHILEIIEALRAEAVRQGFGPLESQKAFEEAISAEHNPYKGIHAERTGWVKESFKLKDTADVLYYVGCTSSYRESEIAAEMLDLLTKMGIDVTVSKDEWCCGSPLIRTGQLKLVKDLAEHNMEMIKKIGAKAVVFSCAGCYRTFKEDYEPLLGKTPDIELYHVTDYIAKLIDDEKINFKEGDPVKVTYHDPCHAGRHCGIYDSPRKVLKSIPGVELIEMKRNRENAWCCGAGGGVKSGFRDWAVEIASERIKEAEETGAAILVSSCPFCKRNLMDAIKATKSKLKFMDVTELVNSRIA